MSRAKSLDRLELTRQKFGMKNDVYVAVPKAEVEGEVGLKICPMCGSKGLKLDGGCMSCLSCGWSACG